jgi:predicted transcriptional regulator
MDSHDFDGSIKTLLLSIAPAMPTSTVENYLKAILRLERGSDGPVAVGRIATELEVTPGTVTTMMKHLGRNGLIDYTPARASACAPKAATPPPGWSGATA